MIGSTK